MSEQENKVDIRAVQLVMLQIMDEIDKLCQRNGLHYVLDGGTLLGAVRHKGFIPWDDDMDILMPRDDYKRFIQLAKEQLPAGYTFQCIENTKYYPYNFGKVRATNTLFRERMTGHLPINQGIYVDVFPMDYVDVSHPHRLDYVLRWISHYTMLRYQKLKMVDKKRYQIARLIPMRFINKRISALMEYRLNEQDNMMAKLCHQGPNKPPVSVSLFEDTILVPFENKMFRIPAAYDQYLTGRYGRDYMIPPPPDKRDTHGPVEVKI